MTSFSSTSSGSVGGVTSLDMVSLSSDAQERPPIPYSRSERVASLTAIVLTQVNPSRDSAGRQLAAHRHREHPATAPL